jgi:hypothetical protein
MKSIRPILLAAAAWFSVAVPTHGGVFINEIHYDNQGSDTGEFVEIAGPAGTDLSGWSIELYNGTPNVNLNGTVYGTISLSGVLSDIDSGFGFQVYPYSGIQNGSPDGLALVNNGSVVQFLSYEGTFTGASGTTAAGLTSTDIGVSESGSTSAGFSLQLTGTGSQYSDFTWSGPSDDTPGAANNGQTFVRSQVIPEPGSFAIFGVGMVASCLMGRRRRS